KLYVERSRELRKTLAHPLVVITVPADDVSPPLMRDFVWGDVAPEVVSAAARSQQLGALRRVDKGHVRHVDERGPCLSETGSRLLRHGDATVRQLSKISVVDTNRVLSIRQRLIGNSRGGN